MTVIENWKDLVGYQPYEAAPSAEPQPWWRRMLSWLGNLLPGKQQKVYYLTHKTEPDGRSSIVILSARVPCNLKEAELHQELDAILTEFPEGNYAFSDTGKARAGIQVARQSRRGVAKAEYKRSIFYCGTNALDRAVFVAKRGGRYGIFKHPNFDQYGFSL
jgi:hypothetical protein